MPPSPARARVVNDKETSLALEQVSKDAEKQETTSTPRPLAE